MMQSLTINIQWCGMEERNWMSEQSRYLYQLQSAIQRKFYYTCKIVMILIVTGQMSDEAVNKDENNLVMTGVPVECEEESSSSRVPAVVMKAGRKQNKQS